jgi:hypothetical protein
MQKTLLILSLIITVITAQTIKPKRVQARDSIGHRGGGHHNSNDPFISTVEVSSEASFEISVQITSVVTTQASSEATSGQQKQRSREYSELEFLNNNRPKITEDISNGGGEHLITLMGMMHLNKDRVTLAKVQSNFETLLELEDEAFLLELREVSNS